MRNQPMNYTMSNWICRFGTAFLAALTLAGCGSEPEKTVSKADQLNALETSAKKLEDDPNASPQAKSIAAGAARQVETTNEVNGMMQGK